MSNILNMILDSLFWFFIGVTIGVLYEISKSLYKKTHIKLKHMCWQCGKYIPKWKKFCSKECKEKFITAEAYDKQLLLDLGLIKGD